MKQVLIVEDQRMPRENMERTLSDSGRYELVASLNGADVAVLKCGQQHIDLILMRFYGSEYSDHGGHSLHAVEAGGTHENSG